MFEKKKVQDWITNLGLGLEEVSGELRDGNGVYNHEKLPFKISKIVQKQKFGESIDLGEKIIFDYTISLFGKENKDEYHIKAEQDLPADSNGDEITGVTLELNGAGLTNEVSRLKEIGYKVKLYSDGKNRNIKHLVAINKDEIITKIEKTFIKINIEKESKKHIYESALNAKSDA